jgi:hypothetical protein
MHVIEFIVLLTLVGLCRDVSASRHHEFFNRTLSAINHTANRQYQQVHVELQALPVTVGDINKFAGTYSNWTSSGDGGAATSATFGQSYSVDVDKVRGKVFILDSFYSKIR